MRCEELLDRAIEMNAMSLNGDLDLDQEAYLDRPNGFLDDLEDRTGRK
jgi:hypothetical protein